MTILSTSTSAPRRLALGLATALLGGVTLLAGCKKDDTQAADTSPLLHIVSPVAGAVVAPGVGRTGAGSFDGAGFLVNLEIVTQDTVTIPTKEGLNIRNAAAVGSPNVNLPGLTVSLDVDLTNPAGVVIAKGTNLASLFNIAGTDDTPGPGVTTWVSWHVLESLPAGTTSFNLTAAIKDRSGRTTTTTQKVSVGTGPGGVASGQALTPAPLTTALTPAPLTTTLTPGADDPAGPTVTLLAPRAGSSISPGIQTAGVLPTPPSQGALFFVQVSALDKSKNGIGVNENALGKADADRGTIVDGTQSSKGPNRYAPGLVVTFDVPLLQPNGNVIAAGGNLAPVFNTAGSEMDPSGYVRTTFGWTVGGTLQLPAGKTSVTVKAAVVDNAGKTGSATQVLQISPVANGQLLTPAP